MPSTDPKNLVEKFASLKPSNLISRGTYDDLYRVRDLENDIWQLARFYSSPFKESEDIKLEFGKSELLDHESIIPISGLQTANDYCSILWQFQDGLTLEERMKRELNPRTIATLLLRIVNGVEYAREFDVRFEYLSIRDILVDVDDNAFLFAGTFSHCFEGPGDNTHLVDNYDLRALNRLGAILLTLSFGRENVELIQAVQLETDIKDLMFRFTDLLNIDPNLMAITAKCLMADGIQVYREIKNLQNDLENYLKGRAVSLGGVDFNQLIKSWNMRKSNS